MVEAANETMVNSTTAPSMAPSLATVVTVAPTSAAGNALAEFVQGREAVLIAFVCMCFAVAIAGANIFRHLVHYNDPGLQKNIVRILFMVPFYAMLSFLSLLFPSLHVYFDSVRDVYEAFVVYCFLNLMLSYCGGENACLSVIMHNPGTIRHVAPLNCCLPEMAMTSRFLRLCKQGTLQFVIVKPIMAVINLGFELSAQESNRTWDVVQAVIYNSSYTLALYMLVLFYKATHDHPGLKSQYPVLKFLSVKLVVFATYYQSVVLVFLPGFSADAISAFNDFLLCSEMVFFAALQYGAFSWREFADSRDKGGRRSDLGDSIGDIEVAQRPPGNEAALNHAKDIMSMKDVASDAYYNFNNKYGEHVLLDSGDEASKPGMGAQKSSLHTDVDLGVSENPFGATAMDGFGARDHGAAANAAAAATAASEARSPAISDSPLAPMQFDPNLPAFDADKDGQQAGVNENPFAQDLPALRRGDSGGSALSAISVELGLGSPGDAAAPRDTWAASFGDEEEGAAAVDAAAGAGSPKSANRKKKKKKGKKQKAAQSPPAPPTDLDLI